MERWIRSSVAVESLIDYGTGEVKAHGITYAVAHERVATMDYNPAIAVKGTVLKKRTKGPFQIGPMSIGKVHSEAAGFIDADWYFEIF